MNIIEAFNAVKEGKRVRYVLTGREAVIDALGNFCWRDTEGAVLTHIYTRKDDAFEVIEPAWKKATLREAFAALAEGKTASSDPDMPEYIYHFTDDDILVNGDRNRAYVSPGELMRGAQWYILEDS